MGPFAFGIEPLNVRSGPSTGLQRQPHPAPASGRASRAPRAFPRRAASERAGACGTRGHKRRYEDSLRSVASAARDLLHPLRLALTGKNRGPEMAYLFAVLGAEEARERMLRAREARLGA